MVTILICCAAAAEVRTIRVPDGGLAPQAAVDGKGMIHLIYFKGDARGGDIFYVTSADSAKTFSTPIRVNSVANTALIAGTIRGPHLALGRNGRPHVAWMGSHVAAKASPAKETPMLYTRLGDDGRFEPQRDVIATHVGLDGGGSIAADAGGKVYVAWHAPEKKDGGESTRKLWVAASHDDGKTFAAEVCASTDITGACACCSVKIVASENGEVAALFRNAMTKGKTFERATIMARSTDAGKTFTTQQLDHTTSGTCLMSSYGIIAIANGYRMVFENAQMLMEARYERSDNVHTEPQPIGDRGKHPSLAINAAGDVVVAYSKGAAFSKPGTLGWSLYKAGGAVEKGAGEALPAASVPAAVALPDGDFVIVY
jgi:hypothetical protein